MQVLQTPSILQRNRKKRPLIFQYLFTLKQCNSLIYDWFIVLQIKYMTARSWSCMFTTFVKRRREQGGPRRPFIKREGGREGKGRTSPFPAVMTERRSDAAGRWMWQALLPNKDSSEKQHFSTFWASLCGVVLSFSPRLKVLSLSIVTAPLVLVPCEELGETAVRSDALRRMT